jgi:small subunit ribosomal protein S21
MTTHDNALIELKVDERMGIDRTLRKFKRLCESYGIVREYRNRQEYKKPSIRAKEKVESAQKRRLKAQFKLRRSNRI